MNTIQEIMLTMEIFFLYGYGEDTSVTVNGTYPINVKVHYLDHTDKETETIYPARLSRGSGKYRRNPRSIRSDKLPQEEELMNEKTVDVNAMHIIALNNPLCGASFKLQKDMLRNIRTAVSTSILRKTADELSDS